MNRYIAVLVLLFSFTQAQGVCYSFLTPQNVCYSFMQAQDICYNTFIVNPCTCGKKYFGISPRIAGGDPTLPNEYPMMVAIFYVPQFVRFVNCGGTIISENYVLTAAHCVQNVEVASLELVAGEHNITVQNNPSRQVLRAASYTVHPDYNRNTNDYDIAIIRVSGQIKFNSKVGVVCLPMRYAGWDLTGLNVILLGWGLTSFGGRPSDVLREAYVNIISRARCRMTEPAVTSRQICTQSLGKDSCQYDSGGPVLYHELRTDSLFLIGIISYGKDCGEGINPGVNTDVSAFLSWIQLNAPEDYCIK